MMKPDARSETQNLTEVEATLVPGLDRRSFLRQAGGALGSVAVVGSLEGVGVAQAGVPSSPASRPELPNPANSVELHPIHADTEAPDKTPGPFDAPDKRVGFAVVGLGRLAINQILPAFAKSTTCRVTALVSGDRAKALKLAAQYGVPDGSVYDYAGYETLAKNPDVQVIYIVLPNAMHREYVERGARTGKHILCEKPMATSVADCEAMIAACQKAGVKLMIAYRQQYEPMNRALGAMVKASKLGQLRSILATNTQNEGDPSQWRLKKAMAGGGCLPDVGIYCLNAARFLSGEEPVEVSGHVFQPKEDPRFAEVEATCSFTLRFPSGLLASCSTGYAGHHSSMIRLEGSDAWGELNPSFAYTGLKLRTSRLDRESRHEVVSEPQLESRDQFALEMEHMAECVLKNETPHTPGEEGLQDQRLMDAIYESARTGKTVKVKTPEGPTRGVALAEK